MLDLTPLLGPSDRSLSTRDVDGSPAKVLRASRTYDTSVEDLWDCLTNPDRLPRWFMPISGELRPGGRYQLEGNAGGEIRTCDAPRHLAVTWEIGGVPSWVDVRLSPDGDGARLDLEHVAHVPEDMWAEYGPGATGIGWDLAFMGLANHVTTGEAIDPDVIETWHTTEEGRGTIAAFADAWRDAAIDDGEDPAEAARSAANCQAFYTGQPAVDG
ncbi:SRPBCC family protein [Euzebya sp.]|uniref:SRPBCC family protein n=1 Tax=Euzebya sp. TaxID=1971409 RepID=UPI0035119A8F